tara:strand:- start:521 stop:1279 length:759 start_codon:yes stop_codon:yes gene_type:complete
MKELNNKDKLTNFGFKKVSEKEKVSLVNNVFSSVTKNYDLMNDLMSFGLHRAWKGYFLHCSNIKNGDKVLDLASGTGDITKLLHKIVGENGQVISCDINYEMLSFGRDNLIDKGIIKNVSYIQSDALELPFKDKDFDHVTMAFGLRNTANISRALKSIHRVIKPGGSIQILEFSKPEKIIQKPYSIFLEKFIPSLGKLVANDKDSYKYLAESIKMHPPQREIIKQMETSGFVNNVYNNLLFGVASIHRGYKI